MKDHILSVKDLVVSYKNGSGDAHAVDQISFDLKRGMTLGVVGESGSGKSTLAFTLMGLIDRLHGNISRGSIKYFENKQNELEIVQCSHESLEKLRGKEIALIFQEPSAHFDFNKTCGYQLSEMISPEGNNSLGSVKEKAIQLLRKVGIEDSERAYNSYPYELSGGQLQRVMIAIAIAQNPKVLIADEPTTALDVTIQKEILKLIKRLQSELGMSTIFISHDLAVVREMADDIIVMHGGKVVEKGNVSKIFENPSHHYTKGLLMCRPPLDRRVRKLPIVGEHKEDNASYALKNTISQEEYQQRISSFSGKKEMLSVCGLCKTFYKSSGLLGISQSDSGINAVIDAKIHIREGEVLGVVGESGSGKSTLGKCIVGLLKPDKGIINFQNEQLFDGKRFSNSQSRTDIQMIFQDPYLSLNPRMKIGESLGEPLIINNFKKNIKEEVLQMLKRVGLEENHYDRYPHEFSGGQRQRLCIARALIVKPKLLICDEILTALDVSVQAQILNLISDLKKEFQLSVLFISHDLSVIKHISDFVAVMKDGRIIEYGDAESVFHHPQKEYTKMLLEAIPLIEVI